MLGSVSGGKERILCKLETCSRPLAESPVQALQAMCILDLGGLSHAPPQKSVAIHYFQWSKKTAKEATETQQNRIKFIENLFSRN